MEFSIISNVKEYTAGSLQNLADALSIQARDHLYPNWGKTASVSVGKTGIGIIPIYVDYEIDSKEQNGYHWVDSNKNPFIRIKYNYDFDQFCLTTSHEFLETIINPTVEKYGNPESLQLVNKQGEEFFEICDVTQSKEYSYRINGIMVSNFVTPNYYIDKLVRTGVKYDYLGYVTKPGEILDGGYKSWKISDTEVLQAFKAQGILVYKRITGDKSVNVTANSAPLTWILPSIAGLLLAVYFFFFKRK